MNSALFWSHPIRSITLCVAALLGLAALSYYCDQMAWAQDPFAESLEDVEDVTPEPSGEAEASPSQSSAPAPQRTLLASLLQSGFAGLIIFLLSMVGVGIIVEHALTIRKAVLMPEDVIQDLEQLIREGRIDEAIQWAQQPEHATLFSNVVLAGLERYQSSEFGFAEYRVAAEEAGEDQTA